MSTSYFILSDRFIKKLKNDKSFMSYKNLTDEEITQLVKDHIIDLINQSIDMIYRYGNPDVNFYNKDDILSQFNIDLVNQEIGLFVDIMYLKYLEEDRNKLKVFELSFRSNELNVFSPAENRRSYIEMLDRIEKKVVFGIIDYFARDRITWNYK